MKKYNKKSNSIKEMTPTKFRCAAMGCPSVYSIEGGDKLVIIGKKADPKELGIADRVGEDEQVIIVDRDMLRLIK